MLMDIIYNGDRLNVNTTNRIQVGQKCPTCKSIGTLKTTCHPEALAEGSKENQLDSSLRSE